MNPKKSILIGVVSSVFAALLLGVYLVGLEKKYKGVGEKVSVLVASKYIDQGSVITDKNTTVKKVPKEFLQPTAITSHSELFSLEKSTYPVPIYMSILPIMEGEQIVASKLWMIGKEAGLSMLIPSEMRSITIVFPRAEVANVLMPGNYVDIIGVFDTEVGGVKKQTALTLVQNVQVLAVGRSMIGAAIQPAKVVKKDRVETALISEEAAFEIPVTLAVTPAQAELISLAKKVSEGIYLAIRSPGDNTIYESKTELTLGKILSRGKSEVAPDTAIKTPSKPPPISQEHIKAVEQHKKEVEELLKRYKR